MYVIENSIVKLTGFGANTERTHCEIITNPKSLVILPTFNEAPNLPELLENLKRLPVDLLFIDDYSTDGTVEILRQAVSEHPEQIFLIERPMKLGLGTAYIIGFKWALARDYELILEMDADLSHDPKYIPQLLAAVQSHDLVIGSRYLDGIRILNWPLKRLLLSICASQYVRAVLGLPLSDPTSGYKCFRRNVLQALDLDRIQSSGYSFQVEINYHVWREGLSIREIPIIFTERSEGKSKMSSRIVFEALWVIGKLAVINRLKSMLYNCGHESVQRTPSKL
jgi:dolichol-phosphate mannosyltransferase